MEFIQQYNQNGRHEGQMFPHLDHLRDRSFKFELKTPPVSASSSKFSISRLGSGNNKKKVGNITKAQIEAIAQKKLTDMNTTNLTSAIKMVEGTAKSMGINITE
jgi:large subunit ribosomal protein L11